MIFFKIISLLLGILAVIAGIDILKSDRDNLDDMSALFAATEFFAAILCFWLAYFIPYDL